MTSDLQETAVEKITLVGGESVLLYQAKHQHFMNDAVLIGKPVDDETFEILVEDNAIVLQQDIAGKIAIGRAADGTYHEAPHQTPWSERV